MSRGHEMAMHHSFEPAYHAEGGMHEEAHGHFFAEAYPGVMVHSRDVEPPPCFAPIGPMYPSGDCSMPPSAEWQPPCQSESQYVSPIAAFESALVNQLSNEMAQNIDLYNYSGAPSQDGYQYGQGNVTQSNPDLYNYSGDAQDGSYPLAQNQVQVPGQSYGYDSSQSDGQNIVPDEQLPMSQQIVNMTQGDPDLYNYSGDSEGESYPLVQNQVQVPGQPYGYDSSQSDGQNVVPDEQLPMSQQIVNITQSDIDSNGYSGAAQDGSYPLVQNEVQAPPQSYTDANSGSTNVDNGATGASGTQNLDYPALTGEDNATGTAQVMPGTPTAGTNDPGNASGAPN